MLVDAVILHWVALVSGEEVGPGGFGRAVQCPAAFFYKNDGLVALPRPSRIQAALYFLRGLFDRVGLHTNVNKIIGMVCQPCYIVSRHLESSYTRRMTGMGSSFWDK